MKIKIKWPLKSILYVVLGAVFGPYIAGAITLAIIFLAGFPIITVEGFNVLKITAICCAFFVPFVSMALYSTEKQRLIFDTINKMIDENTKRIKEQMDLYIYYRTLEEVDGIEYLVDN